MRFFFCDESEYKEYSEECEAYERIQCILSAIVGEVITYSVLQKQIGSLLKEFSKCEICKYLEDYRERLSSLVSSREFESAFIELRFIVECIRKGMEKSNPVEYERIATVESYKSKYEPKIRKNVCRITLTNIKGGDCLLVVLMLI